MRVEIQSRFKMRAGKGTRPWKVSVDDYKHLIIYAGNKQRFNPIKDWLDNLPPWDGVERIEQVLQDYFQAPDNPLTRWAGRYCFLGIIQRTYSPACLIRTFPILQGARGIGKSQFCRQLLPPELQEDMFSDSLRLMAEDKRRVEAVRGAVVVEIPELVGIQRADLDSVKAFLTATHDHIRLSYRHDEQKFPRRYIFIGTTNSQKPLPNDPSGGSGRFIVIPLLEEQEDLAGMMAENRDQLFAEAKALYAQGRTVRLSGEVEDLQRENSETYMFNPSEDVENLLDDAIMEGEIERNTPYALREIKSILIKQLPNSVELDDEIVTQLKREIAKDSVIKRVLEAGGFEYGKFGTREKRQKGWKLPTIE